MFSVLDKEERRAYRQSIREARQRGDEDAVEALREDRREERRERRKERREEGRAPDQVLGRNLAEVWNEEAAQEFIQEDLTDFAILVLQGDLDLDEAVDAALEELSQDADELLDFSGVPVVGAILEMVDGPLFAMFFRETLRPWVQTELRKLL
jgi:hypothetical protein